jgi:hypothetical protein
VVVFKYAGERGSVHATVSKPSVVSANPDDAST